MNAAKNLVAIGVFLALAAGQAVGARKSEQDSVYKWGRWAVLSPAAGGEPYRAPEDVGMDYNARPGEAQGFQPEIARVEVIQPPATGPSPVQPTPVTPPPAIPPVVVKNPPGAPPPVGDPRDRTRPQPPIVVPGQPPVGDPRSGVRP